MQALTSDKPVISTPTVERRVRQFYVRWIRPHVPSIVNRQRLKLLWFVWGYGPLLSMRGLSLGDRLRLLGRFLRVDWHVPHAHRPCEIAKVCRVLAERPARPGEIMVEAGCWQGGSTAKFSLLCRRLGYRLHVYDSFAGVEELPPELKGRGYDYSGQYKASETLVHKHVRQYGASEVCEFHKGWFANTLAVRSVTAPVRVVYVDCDLAKGTREVLQGTLGGLVPDGCVFSQDFHIEPVRELLYDPATWKALGCPAPTIVRLCGNLAALKFS